MSQQAALHLTSLLVVSFGANLPLGYLREGARKFSLSWFVYIHISIPFIILLRLHYGFGWSIVPLTLACAVLGQILGGRMRKRAR
ncbi:hypothetical protein EDC39_11514 [Geothermobacter ehrlichii]|uniref:Uncharacterized protein n=1 Tax=Geothermobacter ehrlichii TaxID=213224 RepID=A0A5D3WJL7_9BACT|nr:hypothetical protein [Geothermobacter ehrlichii]TYO96068.1 hypothetical protein EDC39_11514 [Geothermobacter ehrlichii]